MEKMKQFTVLFKLSVELHDKLKRLKKAEKERLGRNVTTGEFFASVLQEINEPISRQN